MDTVITGALFCLLLIILFVVFADADIATLCYSFLYRYTPFGTRAIDRFRNKVIWITGASSGIGEALAYELMSCDCKLVLSARRGHLLEKVKANCLKLKGSAVSTKEAKDIFVLPFDLLALESHEKMTDHVIKHFGRIDVLVNNAGRSQFSLVDEASMDVYKGVIDLDFMAQVSLTKAVLPQMKTQGGGQILVISSILGVICAPLLSGYCAAKFALMGFFTCLGSEVAKSNIDITIACPGPVLTPVMQNAFGTTADDMRGGPPLQSSKFIMTVDRCAYLLRVALKSRLQEVWISNQPTLIAVYLLQYIPNAKILLKYSNQFVNMRELGNRGDKSN